jgi:hypothetical protein
VAVLEVSEGEGVGEGVWKVTKEMEEGMLEEEVERAPTEGVAMEVVEVAMEMVETKEVVAMETEVVEVEAEVVEGAMAMAMAMSSQFLMKPTLHSRYPSLVARRTLSLEGFKCKQL